MEAARRGIVKGMLAFGAAGTTWAGPGGEAVYFGFFPDSVRLDRYLRAMHGLVRIERVATPSLQGGRSLEMEFRFSEKQRRGRLHWDLSPVRFSRFRVRIWNPNPPGKELYLHALVEDVAGCAWRVPYGSAPLPSSSSVGWILFGGNLAEADCVRGQPDGQPHALHSFSLVFEVRRGFAQFGHPLSLYLDGLECL